MGRLGRTSPPSHPAESIAEYRYYDPLRLPNVHLSGIRIRCLPPIPRLPVFFVIPFYRDSLNSVGLSIQSPGFYLSDGIPQPCSRGNMRTSPVPELPLYAHDLVSDPGGDLNTCHIVSRSAVFRTYHNVDFLRPKHTDRLSFRTATIHFSGLNTDPAHLIRPASDLRYRFCPRTSLQSCRLNFTLVGLPRLHCVVTHWVTLSNFTSLS